MTPSQVKITARGGGKCSSIGILHEILTAPNPGIRNLAGDSKSASCQQEDHHSAFRIHTLESIVVILHMTSVKADPKMKQLAPSKARDGHPFRKTTDSDQVAFPGRCRAAYTLNLSPLPVPF